MNPLLTGCLIMAAAVLAGVVFYFTSVIVASYCIYTKTLVRKDSATWSRDPVLTYPQDEMDSIGQAWMREHLLQKQDVHIQRDGVNLWGEYYDLGYDRAVMILSGRTESLRYGYYFGIPYAKAGFNVLVVDPRGHGLSDGKYNTLGFEESKDALQWVRYLHENHHVRSVVFHGICIGAAGGMLAITAPDCPDYVEGLVTEGMFPCFRESMKNHLIERKRLMWPVLACIDFWMRKYTGHSMGRGPIHVIHKMRKPLLMLQSLEDPYSTPENAKKLYRRCASTRKQLVLFESGGHSLLRHAHTERYDTAITEFLATHISNPVAP